VVFVLDCRVDEVDIEEATRKILDFGNGNDAAQVVTLGTEMVVHAQRDERFRAIVNSSALSLCDTVGLLWAARKRGATLHGCVTGIELLERLCEGASRERIPIYLLGGAEGVAAEAAAQLRERHPGLIVAGTHNGYFHDAESTQIAGEIRSSGARVLFCGMGFPGQEYWLAAYLKETGCGAGVGVGGSFDVFSGRAHRAPAGWRRFGLEWLHRLIREPHRWRRQLALPAFVGLILWDALGLRRRLPA
jgi:N-acetylglucosaminyldiphosphoundecaprenol N-acetyl-beta-D-mannosaminyltransferase